MEMLNRKEAIMFAGLLTAVKEDLKVFCEDLVTYYGYNKVSLDGIVAEHTFDYFMRFRQGGCVTGKLLNEKNTAEYIANKFRQVYSNVVADYKIGEEVFIFDNFFINKVKVKNVYFDDNCNHLLYDLEQPSLNILYKGIEEECIFVPSGRLQMEGFEKFIR